MALVLAIASIGCASTPARASIGYELDDAVPSRPLGGSKGPHGIAVDQANQQIYVAIVSNNPLIGAPGEINRFDSNLNPAGIFSDGSGYYSGVAVNPVTQGFYASQAAIHVPQGNFGTSKMSAFSSAGSLTSSFPLSDNGIFPHIAADSAGDVYVPDPATGKVKVFNSTGTLQKEIGCNGCPGGSTFGRPISVAIDGTGDLYVVDLSPDRVVKLAFSGGSHSYASTMQSGRGAVAVAVDPSDDTVLVGDLLNGSRYHIVAYNSSGTQFDDFGAGLFALPDSQFGPLLAQQIAINATTHEVYVTDTAKFYIFEKETITPPDATVATPNPVGQLAATLRAEVNTNGHAALNCEFEYTDDVDFQANAFDNALTKPCPELPDGLSDTVIPVKVSGLSPVTVYHYRLTISTHAGPATTDVEEFETLPVTASTVTTEPAIAIAETSATLKGAVNPHGGSVSDCDFEYGTTSAYGSSISCLALPEPVSTNVMLTRKVLKLAPSTTYHYRLVVTSNAGTVKGGDVQFTTASPPPPPPPDTPGSPPVVVTPIGILPAPSVSQPTKRPPVRCRRGFRKKRVRGRIRCVRRQPKRTQRHSRRR
jgi:hypothetical protein